MKKMNGSFPQVIYVTSEEDRDDRYLVASKEVVANNNEKVAIYRLVSVKTNKIISELI
jgi:hypothetical protein